MGDLGERTRGDRGKSERGKRSENETPKMMVVKNKKKVCAKNSMQLNAKKVSKNVFSYTDYYWERFRHSKNPEYQITGKYLFFSENRELLKQIAIDEIKNNNFHSAKINLEGRNIGEYVLCLYYKDDSRKYELASKYRDRPNLKYRYWKSDEDTLKGKYSKEFLEKLDSKMQNVQKKIKVRKLYPSYAPPETWRGRIAEELSNEQWKTLRLEILKRDDYTCRYCGFKAAKWQIVHHIDGNPNNNNKRNLVTVCQMCNLIHHAGQGCAVQNVVDLYKKSNYSQNEIIQITRKMRSQVKPDSEIILFLGLKKKMPFKTDKKYLQKLFGFLTSRKAAEEQTQKALTFSYQLLKESH